MTNHYYHKHTLIGHGVVLSYDRKRCDAGPNKPKYAKNFQWRPCEAWSRPATHDVVWDEVSVCTLYRMCSIACMRHMYVWSYICTCLCSYQCIRQNNLVVDTNTVSTFKADANARTPKRARAACHFNAIQATAVRYVGRNGARHRVSAEMAKDNPVKIVWCVHASHTRIHTIHTTHTYTHVWRNYDEMGLLQHDNGKFTDSEVFIVYEDKNEHLHAETPTNGQLPMRLTLNAAVEQVSTCVHMYVLL